ncbi:hypothetical protein FNV43_RR12247 [Rhamnella rubrinervis]|uniref:Uncharacterized protein n=1 Tax=Rhamnella rubrinervis TaxID=2594499 RepID=A0A8K0MIG7_9ROSA|nr:hypothetical protein FNV43_RR12247 [Rhamnella rubrinervis]
METELHEKSSSISSVEAENCGADMDEETSSLSSGCGCFQGHFCYRWCQKSNDVNGLWRKYNLLGGRQEGEEEVDMVVHKESWLVTKAKKVKEASEVLAGPKWKNFIRSINKKRRTTSLSSMQFQYDPQSYALNFDDGVHVYVEPQANDQQFLSTRYSASAPQGIFNNNT